MNRQVMHTKISQIKWMRLEIPCDYSQASRLLALYGFLEYVAAGDGASAFKQGVYAKETGQSRTTVREDLITLSKRGWISVTTSTAGTDVEVHGIPFDQDGRTEGVRTEGVRTEGVRTEGVRPDVLRESVQTDSGSAISKKAVNNSSNEEKKKKKPSSLQSDLIEIWNEHKPSSWIELTTIGKSRENSIGALGGYREVIRLIPAFMAGAKASKFWMSKDISFENIIGTGKTPKGHFHELAERGSNANPDSLEEPKKRPEHPDFFPPTYPGADLRPKVNDFLDDADRDRREAEANEFYAKQEASK